VLTRIARAVDRYVRAHQEYPKRRKDLEREGLISAKDVNGWRCPVCGEKYLLRPPTGADDALPVVFHGPDERCSLALFQGGDIREFRPGASASRRKVRAGSKTAR